MTPQDARNIASWMESLDIAEVEIQVDDLYPITVRFNDSPEWMVAGEFTPGSNTRNILDRIADILYT